MRHFYGCSFGYRNSIVNKLVLKYGFSWVKNKYIVNTKFKQARQAKSKLHFSLFYFLTFFYRVLHFFYFFIKKGYFTPENPSLMPLTSLYLSV